MPVTRMARLLLVSLSLLAAAATQARIVRVDIERVEPAFEGRSFGATGPYDRLVGRAHGVLDPRLPANAVIQDIELAPRNAQGLVEYVTDIEILRPREAARGNGVVLGTSSIAATSARS